MMKNLIVETFWKTDRRWWPVAVFVRVPWIGEAYIGDGLTSFHSWRELRGHGITS